MSEFKILIFSFQSNLFAILFAKISKFRIIIRSNTDPTGYISNVLKKILFKLMLSKADAIVVNSNEFRNNLKKVLNINYKLDYVYPVLYKYPNIEHITIDDCSTDNSSVQIIDDYILKNNLPIDIWGRGFNNLFKSYPNNKYLKGTFDDSDTGTEYYIVVKDKDGKNDVIALFSQGKESIVLFRNLGNGHFEEKELISFLPVIALIGIPAAILFDIQIISGSIL